MIKPFFSLFILIFIILFVACGSYENNELTTVKVSEVTRSIFYAPWYVAIELGFFEDEGINIDLITSDGADRVMTALLTGAVDIGLSGPEAAIYVFNEGLNDFAVVFAKLTNRDGSFLISREPIENFTFEYLRDSHILAGRRGGMPYMVLEYVTRLHGLKYEDLYLDNTIQFSAMASAFLNGVGDFVTAFEPVASRIELEGRGYIVASIGEYSGELPYTTFYALSSFIENNPDIIQSFTNAIRRGQRWVQENDAKDIANVIYTFFPNIELEILINSIDRYKQIEAFSSEPYVNRNSFELLQDIMQSAGELQNRADFDILVNNNFAKNY
ncbi:MAG: ABC transporter substrate-binding protein [Defluviitaleaceae bacterium]|nr:ABC transporter substrate-binding protein [Defluviitaleaceae bacterium]